MARRNGNFACFAFRVTTIVGALCGRNAPEDDRRVSVCASFPGGVALQYSAIFQWITSRICGIAAIAASPLRRGKAGDFVLTKFLHPKSRERIANMFLIKP